MSEINPETADDIRHDGAWNSFQFDPAPLHDDVLRVADLADRLGYKFLFRMVAYSLDDVQAKLRDEGPSAFLNLVRLQEDISPKASLPSAEHFLTARLLKLAPTSELIITDPYLFTYSRRDDAEVYAASVVRILVPLLSENIRLRLVVDPKASNNAVRGAIEMALKAENPVLELDVVESRDFHDRFWIADRERGAIVGSSLNGIGSRIFLVDTLNKRDVSEVIGLLASLGI